MREWLSGRASPCQGERREFESRLPLHIKPTQKSGYFFTLFKEIIFMNIPNDPAILVSFLNTKLRDYYSSLDCLCDDLELNQEEIIKKCSLIGYEYNLDRNQFI